jgi:hypothetical protein
MTKDALIYCLTSELRKTHKRGLENRLLRQEGFEARRTEAGRIRYLWIKAGKLYYRAEALRLIAKTQKQ